MKTLMRIKSVFLILTIIALVGLTSSCGSDDNKVSSSDVPSTSGGTSDTSQGISSAVKSEISKIKSDNACWYQGGSRLEFVFTGDKSLIASATQLTGTINSGEKSGTALAVFAGISKYNDVIVISKLDGNYFNVYLSLCPYGSLILSGRPYGDQLAIDTYLDYDTYVDLGNIDGAYTEFSAEAYEVDNVPYSEKPVRTTFKNLNL
jgi:hypothetical protein